MGDRILARSEARSHYVLRLASSQPDIHAAQALRFLVFNLELHEGLDSSYATCRDEDPFDDVCDHLIVEDTRSRDVVGTYRLQTGVKARSHLGYYSEQEFDFAPFEAHRDKIIELGRACVHAEHRNLAVLGLLWRGIAAYARDHRGRYMIGCSSLTSQDPTLGAAMYADLERSYLAPVGWRTQPQPAYGCALDHPSERSPKVPKLLLAYLSLGAKICGPPAIDREFKTIDFLTLLDLEDLPSNTVIKYLT
ncbi:MAG: GNAT family N-acetyltransferase [Verrucomicrobia bacterium]|nr:GNAT family N-acetyltransferase [Verrucomicrobiota bacterium]MBI3869667.1 GNAT family N-acetyltransferase [Verrucomicrobiota bacterium]